MKVFDDVDRKIGEGILRLSIQGIENKWSEKKSTYQFWSLRQFYVVFICV